MTDKQYKYYYLAKPFDVLYFRNNKAFDFGEWYSEGIFPPLPSTFQGFVRTSMLLKSGCLQNGEIRKDKIDVVNKNIGDAEHFPFDLTGPYLFDDKNFWHFLVPRDIIKDKDVARQINLSDQGMDTDICSLHYARDSQKAYYLCYGEEFLTWHDLNEYRRFGKFCYHKNELSLIEEHYGIMLEPDKKVREHFFYLTPYQRLQNHISLYFSITHPNKIEDLAGQKGRLGSEARGATITSTDQCLDFKLDDDFYHKIAKKRKFKLILLQPAIFENNENGWAWLPFQNEINENKECIMKHNGLSLKLLYVQTDNSLKISGMNFKDKQENGKKIHYGLKPMMNAVPAGTVYYFEIMNLEEKNIVNILKNLDDNKITNEPYSNMGYNHVVIGKIV